MKKLLLLSSLLTAGLLNVNADLVLPTGMQVLTPTGVTVTVEDSRSFDKAKNMVVAGSPTAGYKTFFTATESTHGEELWVSDGTVAGTKMVKDIFPGETSSGVAWMQRFNDKVVFQAQADVDTGIELWISDGTEAGTYMVKDIHPIGSSNPEGFTQLDETHFIFAAKDFDSETYSTSAQKWLWISDGTENGTILLKDCQVFHPGSSNAQDYGGHFCRVGRKVFFKGDTKDSQYGEELWVTDGSETGTFMLKDINKTVLDANLGTTAGARLDIFTNFYNERLFFMAFSDETGAEPWTSDGTTEGTHLIKDLNPGLDANNLPLGGGLFTPRVYNGKVYFRGYDPVYGSECLATDFTEEGTNIVFDLNTNPTTSGTNNGFPDLLCVFDGVLFMKGQTGTDPSSTAPINYGLEFFYTDGTAAGSKMQSDLNPGVGHNAAWEGIVISGSMFCRAQNAVPTGSQTWELFRLDSKDEFPQKVMDLVDGQDFVHSIRNMNGDAVFTSKAIPSLFTYHYRKANYDPAKDTENMEIEYRTRDEISGVKSIAANVSDLEIFPNPAQNVISLQCGEDIKAVSITDITGKVIFNAVLPVNNQLDISTLKPGMYTVIANHANGLSRNMLIVK